MCKWSCQILIWFLLLLLLPSSNMSTKHIASKTFRLHSFNAAPLQAAPVNHPSMSPTTRDRRVIAGRRLNGAAFETRRHLFSPQDHLWMDLFFLLLLRPFISDSPEGDGCGGRGGGRGGGGGVGQVDGSGEGEPVRTGLTSLSCGGS